MVERVTEPTPCVGFERDGVAPARARAASTASVALGIVGTGEPAGRVGPGDEHRPERRYERDPLADVDGNATCPVVAGAGEENDVVAGRGGDRDLEIELAGEVCRASSRARSITG